MSRSFWYCSYEVVNVRIKIYSNMSGFHAPTGYAKFNVWPKIIRLPLDLFLAAVNYLTKFCMSLHLPFCFQPYTWITDWNENHETVENNQDNKQTGRTTTFPGVWKDLALSLRLLWHKEGGIF